MKLTRNSIVYICVFGICLISVYAGLADTDYYWQVSLGKSIIKDFNFNAIYNLCWGTLGISEYLDHEWLTNVVFYLFSLLGVRGISVLKIAILLFVATCTCLYMRSEKKSYNNYFIVSLFAYLFIMAGVFFKVKAYTISIGFVLLEVMFLKKYNKSRHNKYFLYMLILCILWNNMHSGSIPLFFVIAGLFWITNLRQNKLIPLLGIGYLLSTSINPYGFKLMIFNLAHNGDSVMKDYVLDWKAIDGKTGLGMLCIILVFIVIVSLWQVDLKTHLFDVIMIFAILFLGMQSARHLIYLLPFFISICIDNKVRLFSITSQVYLPYVLLFIWGIAILCTFSTFTEENYDEVYAMDFVDEELENLLVTTNKDDSTGLFVSDIDVWSLDLQSFTSGAFPCTRQRFLDAYLMSTSASNNQIESVIEHYNLTKFAFIKFNIDIDYYNVNSVLYDYLSNNDEYVCLYDSDFYCYFVERGIADEIK